MAPSKNKKFKKAGSNLAKRLAILETKQKADDKSTEYKVQYYDQTFSMSSSWTSASNFMFRTTQGVGAEGGVPSAAAGSIRIGNKINLRSNVVHLRCSMPRSNDGVLSLVNPYATQCRIMFVSNLTSNDALAIADVLNDTRYPIISPYKNSVAGGKRYKILADYKFTLTNERPDKLITYKMKLPKSGRVLNYASALDTNPSDFNVTMLWISADTSPVSPNQPDLRYISKSRFTDA